MRKAKTVLAICLVILLVTHTPIIRSEDDLHRVWAVKDCRIVTQAGPPIEKGTVVIRDGLIEDVGSEVPVPADAEVIDGRALTAYPGLIDPLGRSLLKLPELKFDQTKVLTGQYTDEDRGINPGFKAFDFFEITKGTLENITGLVSRPPRCCRKEAYSPVKHRCFPSAAQIKMST